MAALSRGPGGGPKRRIRTRLNGVGNTIVVGRNRSNKPIPVNWRELLVSMVETTCRQPPSHFKHGQPGEQRAIPMPRAIIPEGSLPTAAVLFVCSLDTYTANLQRRAIDFALQYADVRLWPVPEVTVRQVKGEVQIRTNLIQEDQLGGFSTHRFNAYRLKGLPDINWQHVEAFTPRRGKAQLFGIRTRCGKKCSCHSALPKYWQLGWEMHY